MNFTVDIMKLLVFDTVLKLFKNVRTIKCYKSGLVNDKYLQYVLDVLVKIENQNNSDLQSITITGKDLEDYKIDDKFVASFNKISWKIGMAEHLGEKRIRIEKMQRTMTQSSNIIKMIDSLIFYVTKT